MSFTQLLVDYEAANVRLFFRVYFIVLGLTVGPLGNACSSIAAKLRLAKRQNVELTKMLGWLGGVDCMTTMWKTRAFPSGFLLSCLMLLAFSLSIASDLISAYIRSVSVHDRCQFGTGLVLQSTRSMSLVPFNGFPYTVVTQAQTISVANGGLQGIYAKANQAVDFSADDLDVLGNWRCTQEAMELDYALSTDPNVIAKDLVAHGFLYHLETAVGEVSDANTSIEHMVYFDASNDGTVGTPWDVKASVSSYDAVSNTNTMLSFHCALNDRVGWLNNTLSGINAANTIADWIQLMQGACYSGTGTPARSDLGSILERIFNSMVMIASGGNRLLDSSQASSTQGCLTTRTWVTWEALALAALAAILNAFLILYLAILKLLEIKERRHGFDPVGGAQGGDMRNGLENIPGGLLGWTVQAVRESQAPDYQHLSTESVNVEEKHLRSWKFGWLKQRNRCGIVIDRGDVEEIQLLVGGSK